MNKKEHLLVVLMEECAELQQATAKALRFGINDGYPNTPRTNLTDMAEEFNQLIAVVEMLKDEGMTLNDDCGIKAEKKAKVDYYLEYAKQCGTLTH